MVFCVGDGPLGIPRERGLYSMQHKHSQSSTGESTSQSVPGLIAKASPPPITMMILTHTWTRACMQATHMLEGKRECFHTHTCTRLASFLLHILNCPQCPPSVYSWDPSTDTISFYLNYTSQLPVLLCKNYFSSSLMLALVPSVSFLCLLQTGLGVM